MQGFVQAPPARGNEPSVQARFEPPPYSADILAPPIWNGPPGQLLPFSTTSTISNSRYTIYGTESQVLQVHLDPGESIVSEPGAMMHRAPNVRMSTTMGGCINGFKRKLSGESWFRNIYKNQSKVPACVALTPNFAAKIIPVDLSRSGTLHVAPGMYMAHIGDVHITFKFVRSCLTGCFGGNGFVLQKLTGTGTVFLSSGGTNMEKILAPGELLIIDHHSLLAFSETAEYGTQRAGDLLTICCGGEGIFNTLIQGPGLVIVQSMSQRRFIESLTKMGAIEAGVVPQPQVMAGGVRLEGVLGNVLNGGIGGFLNQ